MDSNEGCYVYVPGKDAEADPRPNKKRKTTNTTGAVQSANHAFVPLVNGKESVATASFRAAAFEAIWAAKERNLENVLEEANHKTIEKIVDFIANTDPSEAPTQIPTGLVTAGLATSSSGSMHRPISQMAREEESCMVVCVPAAECSNLKSALKIIISNGVFQDIDINTEGREQPNETKRLLTYDLQALQDFMDHRALRKCVLFFQSSEAIDGQVLADLVDVLSSWHERIPFIILFEIAVSIELFQEKLSQNTIRQLRGVTFESKSASEILDLMFRAATSPDETNPLYLGPETSKILLDRQEEHIQSAKGFISALKYMYMTHFFNNPLSLLLSENETLLLQKEHLGAIRELPSFKDTGHIDDLIAEHDDSKAQLLLQDDAYLSQTIPSILHQSRSALSSLLDALNVLIIIHTHADSKSTLTWSTLYIKALSGSLKESPLHRELSLAVRKFPSDVMTALISALAAIPTLDLGSMPTDLAALSSRTGSDTPLRSEYDAHYETTRTTVVANKVALAKHKAALSAQDAEYNRFVSRLDGALRSFFLETVVHPREIPLSEVLVFDARGAMVQALGAAPRAAVERALSAPVDYLDCECCGDEEEGLSGTQPATAVLYQLYLEGGAMINIEDLWRAFRAVVWVEEDDGEKSEETLALFYRALAELKYLGMIKNCRKKADHLMKLRWKGL